MPPTRLPLPPVSRYLRPRLQPRSHPFPRLPLARGLGTNAAASADSFVHIVEVGPRDGLQNEAAGLISTDTRLMLVRKLAGAGLRTIEAGAFVSPKWVPQMADTPDILARLHSDPPPSPHPDPVAYNYLIPNLKGWDNFLAAYAPHHPDPPHPPSRAVAEISLFTAATESFSRANQNAPIATTIAGFPPLIAAAKARSLRVRAYISAALGCPYEGPPTKASAHRVADLATSLLEMGADEVALGDTTGMGTVPRTAELLATLQAAGVRPADLALHFHDSFGMALCNAVVGLEAGVRKFDASVGGLGGCPYAVGATGNVATEEMVYLVESLGMRTGVNLEEVSRVGEWVARKLGREDGRRETRVGKAILAGIRRRESGE